MPVVELAGVTKAYENKVAVNNLSLSIEAGQMFGLLGPNGAGKTSSIRMMMGITMPDSGRVTLFGRPFDRKSLERVGYLPEERGLYKKMKVIEQLVFFGELHGLDAEEARKRSVDWAKRLEIADSLAEEDRRAFQRHAAEDPVHRALLHDPGLIVMDEPFSGLDPVNATLLERTLLELKDQGKAILFSTHRMDQVEKLCDSICLVNKGQAVLAGKMREIKSRYERNRVIVEFEGSDSFLKSPEIAEAKNFAGHAEIRLQAARRRAEAAARSGRGGDNLPIRAGRAVARRDLHSDRGRQGRCVIILLVARREYLEQIRGRAFRVSTILVPVLFAGIFFVAMIFGPDSGVGKHIVIAAHSAELANAIRDEMVKDKDAKTTVDVVAPATAADRDDLIQKVQSKAVDGMLWIDTDGGTTKATYTSQSSGDIVISSRLSGALNHAITEERMTARGMSKAETDALLKEVSIDTLQVDKQGKEVKSSGIVSYLKGYIMALHALDDHHDLRHERGALHHSGEDLAHLRGDAGDPRSPAICWPAS